MNETRREDVLVEALTKIRDRKQSGKFVIRDGDIARAALDVYRNRKMLEQMECDSRPATRDRISRGELDAILEPWKPISR